MENDRKGDGEAARDPTLTGPFPLAAITPGRFDVHSIARLENVFLEGLITRIFPAKSD